VCFVSILLGWYEFCCYCQCFRLPAKTPCYVALKTLRPTYCLTVLLYLRPVDMKLDSLTLLCAIADRSELCVFFWSKTAWRRYIAFLFKPFIKLILTLVLWRYYGVLLTLSAYCRMADFMLVWYNPFQFQTTGSGGIQWGIIITILLWIVTIGLFHWISPTEWSFSG